MSIAAGNKKPYDYLIVGSGLFGATFACMATRQGKRCLVIDKRPHTGGNIYSEEQHGINVHKYGCHIFHTSSKAVWDFVNSLVSFNRFTYTPVANYEGRLYNLPFNMNTFYQMWGCTTPDEAAAIIESQKQDTLAAMQKCGATAPRNLEEQALSLVGRDIYEKLIKGYTEKQWGTACCNLPADLIKRLPMRFTWNNNYFNDKYQGIPEEGYTKWIENMIFQDAPSKINLMLGIDFLDRRIELESMAGHVFYSGRPDLLCGANDLPFRGLKFETSVMPIPDFQGTAVVNHNTKDVPYTRTIEHKHFQPWKESDRLCDVRNSTTVVTTETPCMCDTMKDEPYYPFNNRENDKIYRGYAEATKGTKIHLCGRLGLYRYLDMDDCIETALKMADEWCAKL